MVFKISNDAPLSCFLKVFFGMFFKLFGVSFHIMVHRTSPGLDKKILGVHFCRCSHYCVTNIAYVAQ